MYLICPLCRDEWIFTTKICKSCDKIRYYMEIYSKSKILEILDKVLVVQQHVKNKKENYIAGDDNVDYEKPITGNQKK